MNSARVEDITTGIIVTQTAVLNAVKYTLSTVSRIVKTGSRTNSTAFVRDLKNVPLDIFPEIANYENYPFRGQITNIRYSPLIYDYERDSHEQFGREDIGGIYDIVDSTVPRIPSPNRPLLVPVYNQDPLNLVSSLGFDLYNFPSTTEFINKLTKTESFFVSGPIVFFTSRDDDDTGFYFGELTGTDSPECINAANSFTELTELNRGRDCLLGMIYSAVLVREFIGSSISLQTTPSTQDLYNELEFFVVSGQEIRYRDRSGRWAGRSVDQMIEDVESTEFGSHKSFVFDDETELTIGFMFGSSVTPEGYEKSTDDLKIVLGMLNLILSLAAIVLVFLVSRNIQRIQKKKDMMESAVRVLNHETRGPLNSIALNAQIGEKSTKKNIAKTGSDTYEKILEKTLERFVKIRYSTKAIENVLIDIKDLRAIEKGTIMINNRKFKAGDALKAVKTEMEHKREEYKHLEFIDPEDEFDTEITADRDRVKRIIYNFVTNALRHTETGSITTGVRTEPGLIVFYVADTGSGIDAKTQKQLFRHRIDSEGMGIGLMICAKYTAMMNGRIDFTTRLGEGTEMRLILPLGDETVVEVE